MATAPIPNPQDESGFAPRLAALRAELARRNLDGFLVPRADEHQGEYVAPGSERLAWLSGFTGSAGLGVVTAGRAILFVDGRYTLQVRAEADGAAWEFGDLPGSAESWAPAAWIAAQMKSGMALGYDPWLTTRADFDRFSAACAKVGARLVATEGNPIDAVWRDRPGPPAAPAVPYPLRLAGRESSAKRHAIGATLAAEGIDAAILTAPDGLAWLLNLRGDDIPHVPVALGFGVLHADGRTQAIMEPTKLDAATRDHLGPEVEVIAPAALGAALDALGRQGRKVRVVKTATPMWMLARLEAAGAKLAWGEDPCARPRACKNATELEGMRAAHRRDGAALVRFLAWLSRQDRPVGELEIVDRLEAFRRQGEDYRGPSFATIAGAGPNGAIVHYRPSAATERQMAAGVLLLLDSGGQYLDGTTDVTRTVIRGVPNADMRDRFTRVLRGHIALASAVFPAGTTGSQLDALARRPLWTAGLDYDHGTGHGVGCYLNVHEGPQRIAKAGNTVALEPGMVLSVEPGYYKPDAWGIRIENLVVVCERPPAAGAERKALGFEPLTLVPIDQALIDVAQLDAAERAWFDAYHARVRAEIGPQVDAEVRAWLDEATRPLAAGC